MDSAQDDLLRAYSRLSAMRANFATSDWIDVKTGSEYDDLVDRISNELQTNLGEFKAKGLPSTEGHPFYEGNAFRSRLDGLLNYLRTLMPQEAKKRLGF